MSVQTTYAIDHGDRYVGMLVDGQLVNKVSRLNKSGVTIPYGKFVVSDGVGAAELPSASSTAAQLNGVVLRELNRAYADSATFGAPDKRDMTVVTKGVIYVTVLDTVTQDAPVYARVGATNPGDVSGVIGTGATLGVLVPNTKFLEAGEAGDIVAISIGLGG